LGFSRPIAVLRTIFSCSQRIEVYNPGFSFQNFYVENLAKFSPKKSKLVEVTLGKKSFQKKLLEKKKSL